MDDQEVFAAAGEDAFFELVENFYRGVETDPPLRALYPADLGPGKRHLAMFLMQRFGGPGTYSQQRGHPRLRMRHMGFHIDQQARDAWLRHMREAVLQTPALAPHEALLLPYFEEAATFLVNQG